MQVDPKRNPGDLEEWVQNLELTRDALPERADGEYLILGSENKIMLILGKIYFCLFVQMISDASILLTV